MSVLNAGPIVLDSGGSVALIVLLLLPVAGSLAMYPLRSNVAVAKGVAMAVALAELAPLAFAVPDDPTARAIVVAASRALADLVATVRVPELAGPVVVGGSVVVHGILGAPASLARDLVPPAGDTPVVAVPDGLVGAAVLALRHTGATVDEATFVRLRDQVRAAAPAVR